MKKNFLITGSLLLLFGLLSGCSEVLLEQSGGGNTSGEHSQSNLCLSQVGGVTTTKSIYTDIDATEGAHHLQRIGMIVKQADGAYYGGDDYPLQLFYYKSSGTWEPQGNMLVLDSHQGTVYASSVKQSGETIDTFGAKIKNGRPVLEAPILNEQTYTCPATGRDQPFCQVDQEDYLYDSSHPTVDRENREVTLNMCHFLSRLSFCVMKADGQPAPDINSYVKRVELTATGGDRFIAGVSGYNYTLYLDDGTIADDTYSATIGFTSDPGGNYHQSDVYVENGTGLLPKAFGLVAPVTSLTATVTVTLGAADSDRYDHTYTSAATAFTWEKANHYIYLLTLTDVVKISKPIVASWNEVTLDSHPLQPDGVTP